MIKALAALHWAEGGIKMLQIKTVSKVLFKTQQFITFV